MSVINQMLRDLDHSRRLDPAMLAVTVPETMPATVPATVPANPVTAVSLWRWLTVVIAVLVAGYAGLRWFETAPVAATPALVVNTSALQVAAMSAAAATPTTTPTTAPTTTTTTATTAPQVTAPQATAPQVTPIAAEPVRQQPGSRLAETAISQQQPIVQVVQDVHQAHQAPIEPRPTASQVQPLARSLLPAESVPAESFADDMSPKHMQVDTVVVPAGTATLQAASARQTALTQLAQQARQALAQGMWQQAQQLAQLYVQQAPDDIEGFQLLANAQQQQGDYAAALQSWQQVLQLDPTLARAWLGSALVYDQLSQRAQAKAAYQQALRLGGLAPASQQFIQQRLQQQSSF